MQGVELAKVVELKHLGSAVQGNRECGRECREGGVGGEECQGTSKSEREGLQRGIKSCYVS